MPTRKEQQPYTLVIIYFIDPSKSLLFRYTPLMGRGSMRMPFAGKVLLSAVIGFSALCFAEDQSTTPGAAPEQPVSSPPPAQTQSTAEPSRQYDAESSLAAPVAVATPAPVFGRESREHLSLGANVYWQTTSMFHDDLRADSSDHNARTNLTISPYVGIRVSDLFEIRPALYYNLSTTTQDYTPKDTTTNRNYQMLTKSDNSEAQLGFDVGFFFYPISGSFFRFAVGPSLGCDFSLGPTIVQKYKIGSSSGSTHDTTITTTNGSYIDINIPIRVPFSFDFVPSKHLGFRLTSEIFSIVPNIRYVKGKGTNPPENRTITTTITMSLQKIITDLGIGFFFLF
jgi:hypothetical protein